MRNKSIKKTQKILLKSAPEMHKAEETIEDIKKLRNEIKNFRGIHPDSTNELREIRDRTLI